VGAREEENLRLKSSRTKGNLFQGKRGWVSKRGGRKERKPYKIQKKKSKKVI